MTSEKMTEIPPVYDLRASATVIDERTSLIEGIRLASEEQDFQRASHVALKLVHLVDDVCSGRREYRHDKGPWLSSYRAEAEMILQRYSRLATQQNGLNLTEPQIRLLISGAAHLEAEMDDAIEDGFYTDRDRATLARATERLSDAIGGRPEVEQGPTRG